MYFKISVHLVAPEQTLFYKPFLNLSGGILISLFFLYLSLFYYFCLVVEDEEEEEKLKSEALQAIQTSIIPGFEALLEFIESEYLPATRPGINNNH